MTLLKLRNVYDDSFDLLENFLRNDIANQNLNYGDRFPVDIKELEDEFKIIAELPGITEDDLEITLDDNILNITANRNLDEEDKDYCRREITNGKLERKFKLPDTVDRDNIDANLKNGLLEIKLSKKENTYKRINISTS